MSRFVRREAEDQPDQDHPAWSLWAWYDTERECVILARQGKDLNTYIRYDSMALLFTDQAEYYAVCQACRSVYSHLQWSGSTSNPRWRKESAAFLAEHLSTKGWCEFCDPAFGGGGWRLN